MSSEVETSLISEGKALRSKIKNQRFPYFGRNDKAESAKGAGLRADLRSGTGAKQGRDGSVRDI